MIFVFKRNFLLFPVILFLLQLYTASNVKAAYECQEKCVIEAVNRIIKEEKEDIKRKAEKLKKMAERYKEILPKAKCNHDEKTVEKTKIIEKFSKQFEGKVALICCDECKESDEDQIMDMIDCRILCAPTCRLEILDILVTEAYPFFCLNVEDNKAAN